MNYLSNFFNTTIQLNIYVIVIVAACYIAIHQYRHKPVLNSLDVILNYIPVLTHEFGHVLFNKLAGGRAKDLVIVTSPRERQQTLQQGFAITQSRHLAGPMAYNDWWLFYATYYVIDWSSVEPLSDT